jgi:hypothetical protein
MHHWVSGKNELHPEKRTRAKKQRGLTEGAVAA